MERTDEYIECVDCGDMFLWTVGEQEFYADKLLDPPRRCPACRVAKKLAFRERQRRPLAPRPATTDPQGGW